MGPARPKVRGSLYIGSGAAGIGVMSAMARWLEQRLPKKATEKRGSIWSPKPEKFMGKPAKVQTMFLGLDTDPVSRDRFGEEVSKVLGELNIRSQYVQLGTVTAGQNPVNVYNRLDVNDVLGAVKGALTEANFELEATQGVVMINSMHGSGSAINTFIAERIIPELTTTAQLRAMVAIAADVSRVTSKLNYARSLNWSLSQHQRLLQQGNLDAVIVIDNTMTSAVASVVNGIIPLEKLVNAWRPIEEVNAQSEVTEEDYAGAVVEFYKNIAKLAKLDPAETNDVIAEAVAPLTLVITYGETIGSTLEASSSPQDFHNLANILRLSDDKGNTRGSFVVPGYLPGKIARALLGQYDFAKFIDAISRFFLAPIDVVEVTNLVVVFGENLRESWEQKGISFTKAVEDAFGDLGYSGELDIMYVKNSSSIWLYAVQENVVALRYAFTERISKEVAE